MSVPYVPRHLSAVIRDAASEPFWAGAAEQVFRIRRCTVCAEPNFYPRAVCPYCQGDTAWESASGLGTLYSVSLTRRGGPVPYVLAYVRLDEGVTVLSNVVHGDLEAPRIGDRVRVCFVQTEAGDSVPMFERVDAQ